MNWRTKSENRLRVMGVTITKHPKKIILLMLLVSILIISNLRFITIDTSTEGFLKVNDPALIRYEAFKEQFGQDEKIMVIVEAKDIFSMATLSKLQKLHNALEENVPHLNDITSIINARNTRGEGDRLIVEDLFANFPTTQSALEAIKKTALNNAMYKNLLYNDAHTFTTIILEPSAYESVEGADDLDGFGESSASDNDAEFLSDPSKSEMVRAADKIAATFNSDDFNVFVAGSLAVNDYNKQSVQKDMQKFVKLVLLMMMIFLFVVFRRISAIFLPIFIVLISLLTTIGFMAIVGTPITIPTQILPSFLLAVGIGAVVHLLSMFFKHFNEHEDKDKAISYSLGHSGLAIIMTSLTTAAGLFSFSTAAIEPIAALGIFGALGVIVALINTIVLLPALLAVLPLKPKAAAVAKSQKMDRLLLAVADFSFTHAKKIIVVSLGIAVVFIYLATQVAFKHDTLSWQPDDSPIKISTYKVDEALRGSVTMEVIVDTKKENGLYNAKLLQTLDDAVHEVEQFHTDTHFIGKGWSVGDVLKEIHRALHENNPEYYRITTNDALIPQEFLLFENSGSDDLEDFVDTSMSKARLTFKLPWMEASEYTQISDKIQSILHKKLGNSVEITVTGMVPLFQRTLVAAMDSMATSYVMAFILIAIMMMLLLGSVKIGLTSMIPNVLPIIIALGFMALVDMPLDLFTMLVGAIVIGLSVDDTVHFFHNFSKYHHQGYSTKESVEMTMLGTGRALVATSVVLSLGFFVYMFASLSNLVNFGILAGGAIIIALIANVILGPALLTLITKDAK
ncbi:MMPL family transporter [Sulfurimonas sp. SAG-AH-194-L11]|nr:MMPL family transporter [Sulfurimonas sp. SAG-AH-194-L11]MDF1877257.1 MMPL family transporter [Sulfurimonas sp. SAG-AH-194-L11]